MNEKVWSHIYWGWYNSYRGKFDNNSENHTCKSPLQFHFWGFILQMDVQTYEMTHDQDYSLHTTHDSKTLKITCVYQQKTRYMTYGTSIQWNAIQLWKRKRVCSAAIWNPLQVMLVTEKEQEADSVYRVLTFSNKGQWKKNKAIFSNVLVFDFENSGRHIRNFKSSCEAVGDKIQGHRGGSCTFLQILFTQFDFGIMWVFHLLSNKKVIIS